jgi:hypothetical protein
MERMGRALCAAAVLGGSWVVVSLWLGGGAGLPLQAIAAVAAVAALLGASGLALRSGPAAAVVWLIGFGAPLANTRLVALLRGDAPLRALGIGVLAQSAL